MCIELGIEAKSSEVLYRQHTAKSSKDEQGVPHAGSRPIYLVNTLQRDESASFPPDDTPRVAKHAREGMPPRGVGNRVLCPKNTHPSAHEFSIGHLQCARKSVCSRLLYFLVLYTLFER